MSEFSLLFQDSAPPLPPKHQIQGFQISYICQANSHIYETWYSRTYHPMPCWPHLVWTCTQCSFVSSCPTQPPPATTQPTEIRMLVWAVAVLICLICHILFYFCDSYKKCASVLDLLLEISLWVNKSRRREDRPQTLFKGTLGRTQHRQPSENCRDYFWVCRVDQTRCSSVPSCSFQKHYGEQPTRGLQ